MSYSFEFRHNSRATRESAYTHTYQSGYAKEREAHVYEALQACYEQQQMAWATRAAAFNALLGNKSTHAPRNVTRRARRALREPQQLPASKGAEADAAVSFLNYWFTSDRTVRAEKNSSDEVGKRQEQALPPEPLSNGHVRDAPLDALAGSGVAWECFGMLEVSEIRIVIGVCEMRIVIGVCEIRIVIGVCEIRIVIGVCEIRILTGVW
jgi:hypothetical protein